VQDHEDPPADDHDDGQIFSAGPMAFPKPIDKRWLNVRPYRVDVEAIGERERV
jgi:hypothetical protein